MVLGFAICKDVIRYMEFFAWSAWSWSSGLAGQSGGYQICKDVALISSESTAGLGSDEHWEMSCFLFLISYFLNFSLAIEIVVVSRDYKVVLTPACLPTRSHRTAL